MAEETVSTGIKEETWNFLSPTQKVTLKKMGFKPVKTKKSSPKTPSTRKAYPTLQEYYTIAHIKCQLCGHLAQEAYKMVKTNYSSKETGEPYLRAVKIHLKEAKEGKAKREIHSRPYCVVCKERLKEMDKEELIKLCLKKARQAACRWR